MNVRSLLFIIPLIVLPCACASAPPPSIDAAPDYDPAPAYPHWAGKPATWSKLGDIEDWLAGPGPRQHPEFVPTAQLELAEGRLTLAEKECAGLPAPVLAGRLKASEAGFREVLTKAPLQPTVKARAERGLERIAKLEDLPARPAPTKSVASSKTPLSPGLDIQSRESWHAAPAQTGRLTPASVAWSRITIHHSAQDSKEMGVPTSGNVAEHIKDIQSFHMHQRSWGDIGYHFLIDPTGRIWQGRLLDWQGAHAQGPNNVGNIGICLIGDFNHERPDPRALSSLERLVDALCEHHQIARNHVYGHRRFAATECPGDTLMAWVSRYASGATNCGQEKKGRGGTPRHSARARSPPRESSAPLSPLL